MFIEEKRNIERLKTKNRLDREEALSSMSYMSGKSCMLKNQLANR
jgi:hypothetical protein